MSRIFVLNSLLGVPTAYPTGPHEGGPEADVYLLDYNYQERSETLFARLAEARAAQRLDFSRKTLLLAARGLHPGGEELLALAREFATHHIFFELWNGMDELRRLCDAGIANLYFMPVTTNLRQSGSASLSDVPNRHVFVSLGGDDDLELIREVVARCPELHFHVPDVSWQKTASDKRYVNVAIAAANVSMVDCSIVRHEKRIGFSPAYRAAYDACDIVLITNAPDRLYQMRGGLRVADALHAGKHIVVTENPMCQLLMAQHERTCLVAEHDAGSVAERLHRIGGGRFHVDPAVYDAVRRLTVDEHKLRFMLGAASDPDAARRSVFFRDAKRIERDVEQLLGRQLRAVLLERPPSRDRQPPPWPLLQPLTEGSEISHGWSLRGLGGVVEGGVELTVGDAQGHERRILVCRNDGQPRGIVFTDRFDLFVINDARNREATDEGLAQAVATVAHLLAANERDPRHDAVIAALVTHAQRSQKRDSAGPDEVESRLAGRLFEVLARNDVDLSDPVYRATFTPLHVDRLAAREERLAQHMAEIPTPATRRILLVNATLGLPLYPSIVDFFAHLKRAQPAVDVTSASYFDIVEFQDGVARKGLAVAPISAVMTWGVGELNRFDLIVFVGPSAAMARLMALDGLRARLVLIDLGFYHQLLETNREGFLNGGDVVGTRAAQVNRVAGYSCQPEEKVVKDLRGSFQSDLFAWRWLDYIPIGFSYSRYYGRNRTAFDVALLGTNARDYAQIDPRHYRGLRFLFLGRAEGVPAIERLRQELGVRVIESVDQDTYARLLALCRCVVMPMASENVKNVFMSVVDTLASGRALVTSRHQGLARLERAGVPAAFAERNPSSLYRAVDSTLSDEARLAEIQERSLAFAAEHLDIYRMLWTILEEQVR